MLRSDNGSYGTGWHITNTEFDVNRARLSLLSGEQYQTQSLPPVGGTLVLKDYKLKDLVVKRPDAETLHVIYKDGTVEVLKRHSSSAPYRINAIQFENGESLSFRYASGESLERILDQAGNELLILTYTNNRLSMVDARVDGGRYARTRFTHDSGRLTAVTAPYDRNGAVGTAGFAFSYQVFRNGLMAMNNMRSPMGAEERIAYAENGHAYGNSQYIPRVVRWEQIPAGSQPIMTRTYGYSQNANFTGYPFNGGFREGEDNLYLVAGDYSYWTDETLVDAAANNAVLSVTRTTFNKFHLLTEERVLREGTRTTQTLTYNSVPGLFPAQPANLQLPKRITTRYELVAGGASREVTQTIETDDYGNELSRTEASGVRIDYSYYPIGGESGKCPADPHNLFVRYMKQERLVAKGGTPADRLTHYTHTRMPPTGASYFVVQQSTSRDGVFGQQQSYYDTPVALRGRLKSSTSTIEGHSLVSDFSYTITGDNLVETRRLKGREGQWVESKRTLSLVNRRMLSMTRDGGSTLDLEFDVAGRLVAETASPGLAQQAVRRYAYHFAAQSQRAHLITTDAQGSRVITYFDGMGRQVSEAQLVGTSTERAISSTRYDAQGRIVEVVNTDHLSGVARAFKSTHAYSRWGNASRITGADGRVQVDEYDPQLNLKVEGVEGGERLRTYFNEHNLPIKVERLDSAGASVEVESRTYDGLGRCLSVRDVSRNLTEFTHDTFDRPLTVVQKPADGSAQRLRKIDYAPGTSSELVSALTVDGKRLAARAYDSLGRMTSQTRGTGQATTWEYEAGWMEPVAMVSPRGARQSMAYDKQLDVPSRIEMPGLPASTYRYDALSGAMTRSETNGLIHEFVQDVNGHPEREVQTAGAAALTALYGYSPAGRLLHHTAADGQRSQFEYDTHGRFSRMTTGALVIEQGYDTLGRPQTLTTAYETTRIVTRVSYDTLGRESERRFEQNGALLQVMTSTYHLNSLLATRFLRDASSRVVMGETFTYDAFLRLKTYRCEGTEHPKDHLGRSIVGQDFSFDSLNNITRVVTSFADGSQDTCQRFFTGTDPTQLTRLTHSNPAQDLTLTYDAAGNLQNGLSGRVYTYNGFEQLTQVKVGTQEYKYQYDAESRQVAASRGNEAPVRLAYANDRLDTLVEGSKKIRYHNGEEHPQARTGGVDGPQVHTTDGAGSVRGVSAPGQPHARRHYTPYGYTGIALDDGKVRSMVDLQLPAFNGQRLDVGAGLYHLGNGRRAYDPQLMVFLSPDPLSPFGEGGLNSYAYCAGNPINLVDPSGLWPNWLKWALTGLALALSVVTLGFGAVGLAAAVTGYAAGTVTGIALVSKAAIVAGAAFGVVSGTLGIAGLSVAAVDHQMGWDRSNHINNLGWASFGFSILAWTASGVGAYASASIAYNASLKVAAGQKFTGYANFFGRPAPAALLAAGKRMVGLTYRFADPNKAVRFGQAWGVTRTLLRTVNFYRAIDARFLSQAGPGVPDEQKTGNASVSAQPQSQPVAYGLVDMPGSSANYYELFREEAGRIRRPIIGVLSQA
ncbi:MAG: RHS repeat-associated core domain-containing protein [Pseudomonas proteolytica]|uniref:RHS repeat-associated core domain-containing protein n=1 Tax=Pseudomonas proteolytica TaxID=219574 RepID=UPI003F336429